MSKNKYKVKHRRSRSRNQDKLVATRTFIIITIILVLVLAGILAFKNYYTEAMRLKDDASTLKSSIALCIEALKTGDSAAADNAIAVIDNTSTSMRSTLAEPQWKIPHMIPDLGHDMDTCVMCLDLVDKASDTVLKPASEYIKESGPITADVIDLDNMGPEMGAKLYLYSDMIDTLCPAVESVMADLNAIPTFNTPELESVISKYRVMPAQIEGFMPLIKRAPDEVLRPIAECVTLKPYSSLKADGGIDTTVIMAYMELDTEIRPYIGELSTLLNEGKLLANNPEQANKLKDKLNEMTALLDRFDEYEPLLKAFIGDGSDKMYLIVAQNSAEIRACGGYPGSVGTLTIEDGILKFGDFTAVVNMIPQEFDPDIEFSDAEIELFREDWYAAKARSASANPDFPRVAEIWASSYALESGVTPDGVISMTPHIIQRLMSITGPVTLSNGVTLNEDYCVWYLQHDVYFDYFGNAESLEEANEITDSLFAETANLVEDKIMENPDMESSLQLLEILEGSAEDRTFMVWMDDETEEQTVRELGYSGAVGSEIGVYYSINAANKLGSYVDLKVEVDEGAPNADGTVSYPVTVTLTNTVDQATLDLGRNNGYITSTRYAGDMKSIIYFFAPAGGTIENIECTKDITIGNTEYEGLDVAYCPEFFVKPEETVVFTYIVTTSPNASASPVVRVTPTLTEYSVG